MLCKYKEKIITNGDYLDVSLFPVFAKHKTTRRSRFKPTGEAQKLLNRKNSEKMLTWLLNENFTRENIRLDLTFDDEHRPETEEAARIELRNFKRRLSRRMAKTKMPPLKYAAVLHGGRYHFHMVCNLQDISVAELRSIWGNGWIAVETLEFNQFGLAGLARYMLRGAVGEKLWSTSQNLTRPEAEEHTDRVKQKTIKKLYADNDAAELFENLYPDYHLADCATFYNDEFGYHYLNARMYRKKLDRKKFADTRPF